MVRILRYLFPYIPQVLDYIYLSNGIDFFIIGSVTVIPNQKFAYFVSFFLLPLSLLKMLKSFAKQVLPILV